MNHNIIETCGDYHELIISEGYSFQILSLEGPFGLRMKQMPYYFMLNFNF